MVKKHFSVLDKNAQNLYFLLLFLFILYFDIIFALFLSQWPKSLLMAVKASKYPFFSFQTEKNLGHDKRQGRPRPFITDLLDYRYRYITINGIFLNQV